MFGEFSCLFHGNNFFCALPHCARLALLACFGLGLRSPEKREKMAPVIQGISMQANCLRSQPCFWKIWSFHVNKIKLFRQVFQQNGKLPPSKIPGGPGTLPIMACKGRLPPKVVPFRFQLYERVGRSVGSIWNGLHLPQVDFVRRTLARRSERT